MLSDVISDLEHKLSNNRLDIMDSLSERFINGSPDQVLMALENQVNDILDERDDVLINALTEIMETIEGLFRSTTFCKKEHLPKNNR